MAGSNVKTVRAHSLPPAHGGAKTLFRRIATRYEKLAANYLAMIKLATIRIWLRANESTP